MHLTPKVAVSLSLYSYNLLESYLTRQRQRRRDRSHLPRQNKTEIAFGTVTNG